MLQKCAILGLLLLLAGGLALGWTYNQAKAEHQQAQDSGKSGILAPDEGFNRYRRWYLLSPLQQTQLLLEIDKERQNKSREQLAREQQARLRADLDKLAAGQMNASDIADYLYGRGWQQQVAEYKKRKEQMEITETISLVCLSIGGALFSICAVIWTLRLLVRIIGAWRRRRNPEEEEPEPKVTELTDIETPETPAEPEIPPERPKPRRKVLAVADVAGNISVSGPASRASTIGTGGPSAFAGSHAGTSGPFGADDDSVAMLLTDERAPEAKWSPDAQWSAQGMFVAPSGDIYPTPDATEPSATPDSQTPVVEDPLKEQAEDLQKQITELKQMAQSVQQATRDQRDQSDPLSGTLKELAQQVSAIREYAACQQDRVEKLQDGYDWGIIRTFCLRVIRCIDNIENRMADLPSDDDAATYLEEIRDELLFALESSSVEQYQVEVNSDFRGLEKLAEAIKEKEPTEKPEEAGQIAKVVRPGYRYMLDDENYRVVRTAQVKLFG